MLMSAGANRRLSGFIVRAFYKCPARLKNKSIANRVGVMTEPKPQNNQRPDGAWRLIGLITSLGASVMFGVLFFTIAGIKIDAAYGIAPAGLMIGVIIGVICGVGAAYGLLVRHLKDIDK
jgi:F0F1-type ATP synthase assembly protein I